MTEDGTVTPEQLGETAKDLEKALDRVESAGAALDEHRKKLEAEGRPADVAGAITAVTKASLQAQVEKGRIRDALREERGGDGLDLDAARAEIGRRLARILNARGEGGVSG